MNILESVTKLKKIRNEEIRRRLKVTSIINKIGIQQPRQTEIIWQINLQEKQVKERPRGTLNEGIRNILADKDMALFQAKKMARK